MITGYKDIAATVFYYNSTEQLKQRLYFHIPHNKDI